MASGEEIISCKSCSARNRIPAGKNIEKAFCSKCGSLLFKQYQENDRTSNRDSAKGWFDFTAQKRSYGQKTTGRFLNLYANTIPILNSISLNFYLLIAACFVSGSMIWNGKISTIAVYVFFYSAIIVALCLHEFGHAISAYKGGDFSVANKGYLSLDPFKYSHPIYSIVLPVVFLAMGALPLLGGAVYINYNALKDRYWEALVSASGLIANTVLVLIVSVFLNHFALYGNFVFWSLIAFFIYIEIALILLNALPIPGLDGYGIIEPWLPNQLRNFVQENTSIFQLILIAFIIFPNPIVNSIWAKSYQLAGYLGADFRLIEAGRGALYLKNIPNTFAEFIPTNSTLNQFNIISILALVVAAVIFFNIIRSNQIINWVQKKMTRSLMIIVGLVGIYPLINESSITSCAALESRFIVEFARVAKPNERDAIFAMAFAGAISGGSFASGAVKIKHPNLPPFVGCYLLYYRLVFQPNFARELANGMR